MTYTRYQSQDNRDESDDCHKTGLKGGSAAWLLGDPATCNVYLRDDCALAFVPQRDTSCTSLAI